MSNPSLPGGFGESRKNRQDEQKGNNMKKFRLLALVAPLLVLASTTKSCEEPVQRGTTENKESISGSLTVEDVIHNGKRYVVFTKHGAYDPCIFVIEDEDYKPE